MLPPGEFYLSKRAPELQSQDVVVGQGKVVFTLRGIDIFPEFFLSPGCPRGNIRPVVAAGSNVNTLADNHA